MTGIPSSTDERAFGWWVRRDGCYIPVGDCYVDWWYDLQHVGSGNYQANIFIGQVGSFITELWIGPVDDDLAEEGEERPQRLARYSMLVSCPPQRPHVLQNGKCACSQGYIEDDGRCVSCPARTSSVAGAQSCGVCAAGFLRTAGTVTASSETCTPCPEAGTCDWNTTLTTMRMRAGWWRISNRSSEFIRCRDTANGSVCIGGCTVGTCLANHTGPECLVCTEPNTYLEGGDCHDCPVVSLRVLMWTGICLAATLVATIVYCFARHRATRTSVVAVQKIVKRAEARATSLGLMTKFKIAISFAQVVHSLESTYDLEFHGDSFASTITSLFSWTSFDVASIVLPADCFGAYIIRTTASAFVPIAFIALWMLLCQIAALRKARPILTAIDLRAAVHDGVLRSLFVSLITVHVLVPSISRQIFLAFRRSPFQPPPPSHRSPPPPPPPPP